MAKVSHSIGCHRHGLVKYGQLLRNINFYFAMCCSYRGDETLLNKIFYLDFKYNQQQFQLTKYYTRNSPSRLRWR